MSNMEPGAAARLSDQLHNEIVQPSILAFIKALTPHMVAARAGLEDANEDARSRITLATCEMSASILFSVCLAFAGMDADATAKIGTRCTQVVADMISGMARDCLKGTAVPTFTDYDPETGQPVPFDFRDHLTPGGVQ